MCLCASVCISTRTYVYMCVLVASEDRRKHRIPLSRDYSGCKPHNLSDGIQTLVPMTQLQELLTTKSSLQAQEGLLKRSFEGNCFERRDFFFYSYSLHQLNFMTLRISILRFPCGKLLL